MTTKIGKAIINLTSNVLYSGNSPCIGLHTLYTPLLDTEGVRYDDKC